MLTYSVHVVPTIVVPWPPRQNATTALYLWPFFFGLDADADEASPSPEPRQADKMDFSLPDATSLFLCSPASRAFLQ